MKLPLRHKQMRYYPSNVTTRLDNRKVHFKPAKSVAPDGERYDLIIIGSGISSLVMAGYLSRIGWKVLILEQHDTAGGCTHTFKEKGFMFDTGLHYIGYVKQFMSILDYVTGSDNKIEWKQMGYDNIIFDGTYDIFRVGNKEYRIRSGEENMVSDLCIWFPTEADNIRRYIDFTKRYAKKELYYMLKVFKPVWLANMIDLVFNREFYAYSTRSAYDVVSEFFSDPELIDVICALSIDGGPRSQKQSFLIHAGIISHFLNGGYYPIGGPGVIAQKMIPTIEKAGGKVLVKAYVNEILLNPNKNRAIGVSVTYGFNGINKFTSSNDSDKNRKNKTCEIYSVHGVVSAAGLYNTYKKLLPQDSLHITDMDNIFERVTSNLTYNLLYIGLDKTAEELGIGSANLWMWDTECKGSSFNDFVSAFENDPWNNPPVIFIASNSAKDPSWNAEYPNRCVLIVGAWGMIDQYDAYDTDGIPRKRSAEYIYAKERFTEPLLTMLYKIYPETEGHVVYKELATPETFKHYLNAPFGEVYGLDATTKRWDRYPNLRPETKIEGLWLTGQDMTSLGFGGALMSGILTLNAMLGYGELVNLLRGREFFKDFKNVAPKR